ncbi:MAG: hypothetical protein HRU11_04425 [Parvularculaceae bacterium]|nr:hypothetical protein [Parvularculaceae bacterium]
MIFALTTLLASFAAEAPQETAIETCPDRQFTIRVLWIPVHRQTYAVDPEDCREEQKALEQRLSMVGDAMAQDSEGAICPNRSILGGAIQWQTDHCSTEDEDGVPTN